MLLGFYTDFPLPQEHRDLTSGEMQLYEGYKFACRSELPCLLELE
jgi:hypothetical protein